MNNLSLFAARVHPSPTEGLIQLIIFISSFIIIAVILYFVQIIIRYYRFKKNPRKQFLQWDSKLEINSLLNYILYFAGLVCFWTIAVTIFGGSKLIQSFDYYNTKDILHDYWQLETITFAICAIIWAFIVPYSLYLVNKIKHKLSSKPKLRLHGRLILWSILMYFLINAFYSSDIGDQTYWSLIIKIDILFVIIAATVFFIRLVVRHSISENETSKQIWDWDIKQVIISFIIFIAYFVILLGSWSIVLIILAGDYFWPLEFYGGLSDIIEKLTSDYSIAFFVSAVLWSFVAPYLLYLWKKSKKCLVQKPNVILHLRLIVLSIFIFFMSGIIFANIVSSQPYHDFISDTGIYPTFVPDPNCPDCQY